MSLVKFYLLGLNGVSGLYQHLLEIVLEISVPCLFCTTNTNSFYTLRSILGCFFLGILKCVPPLKL